MKKFEAMIAIRGSLTESEAKKSYEEFLAEIKKHQGEISYEEPWGKIKTAYKISHEEDLHYFVIQFNIDGQKIKDLELFIQINNNIVRSLITKPEQEEVFTKADYEKSIDDFYNLRSERQKIAKPKTRASTTAQLEAKEKKVVKKVNKNETKENLDKVIEELTL